MARRPIRAHGALLVNPRRRRRKAAPKRLSGVRAAARGRTPAKRKRNPVRRRRAAPKRRAAVRRRNPVRRRRTAVRRRRAAARRNPRRRTAAPRIRYVKRRNPKRRRARRNPAGFAAQLRRIPLIGPVLASVVGFAPPAVFGAISVEPTMAVAQILARYFPMVPASAVYVLGGLTVGAAIDVLGPKFKIVSKSTARQLAISTASAAGGVAYYKWRTRQDAPAAAEMGMLVANGLGNPIAGAIMGNNGLGELLSMGALYSGGHNLGDGGPMAVYPMAGGAAY